MDLGLPAGAAKAIWMPVPMVLMLIAATMGVLVTTWLERKISAAAAADWSRLHGALWFAGSWMVSNSSKKMWFQPADSLLFTLGPIIVVIPVFLSLFDCAVWTEPGESLM